jgi:hypothetical protein
MSWAPWAMPLQGPPCATCQFWRPQFQYMVLPNGQEIPDGVSCCQASEMYHDFSCYRQRGLVTHMPLTPEELGA